MSGTDVCKVKRIEDTIPVLGASSYYSFLNIETIKRIGETCGFQLQFIA